MGFPGHGFVKIHYPPLSAPPLKVTEEFFDFTNNPYYVLDSWFSEEAYYTTAYFVDTAIICNGGRYLELVADKVLVIPRCLYTGDSMICIGLLVFRLISQKALLFIY